MIPATFHILHVPSRTQGTGFIPKFSSFHSIPPQLLCPHSILSLSKFCFVPLNMFWDEVIAPPGQLKFRKGM